MHYYRNRYYMPGNGIFTSRDAMWADVHQGWGYVGNAPTMLVDPYGLGFNDWLWTGKWNPSDQDWENSIGPGTTAGQLFASDIYNGRNDPVWGNPTFGAKVTGAVGAGIGAQVALGGDALFFPETGEMAFYGLAGIGNNIGLQLGPSASASVTGGTTYGVNCASDYEGSFLDIGAGGGIPVGPVTLGLGVNKTRNLDHSVTGWHAGPVVGAGPSLGVAYGEIQGYRHLGSMRLPFRLPSKNPFSWTELDDWEWNQ